MYSYLVTSCVFAKLNCYCLRSITNSLEIFRNKRSNNIDNASKRTSEL